MTLGAGTSPPQPSEAGLLPAQSVAELAFPQLVGSVLVQAPFHPGAPRGAGELINHVPNNTSRQLFRNEAEEGPFC